MTKARGRSNLLAGSRDMSRQSKSSTIGWGCHRNNGVSISQPPTLNPASWKQPEKCKRESGQTSIVVNYFTDLTSSACTLVCQHLHSMSTFCTVIWTKAMTSVSHLLNMAAFSCCHIYIFHRLGVHQPTLLLTWQQPTNNTRLFKNRKEAKITQSTIISSTHT